MKIGEQIPMVINSGPRDGQGGVVGVKNRGFKEMFTDAIKDVNEKINHAEELSKRLAMGESVDLAEVMTQMTKADISFRFLLQVRNKALDAYNEIMRMQF